MARMQRFEVSLHDTVKLLTSRAPLDSTAIYPITRYPNQSYETGKIENLSRPYLCLVNSTWARWWRSSLSQVGSYFLIVFASTSSAWWRLASCSPIHHYGRDPSAKLHMATISKWVASIKHRNSSRCFTWASTSSSMTNTTWRDKDHGLYGIFLLMQAHGKIPNHSYKCHTHISRDTKSHLVHLVALCVDHSLDQPYIFSSYFLQMMMSWR